MNRHPERFVRICAAFWALSCLLTATPAAALDEIGIYWDTEYSITDAEIPEENLPAQRTGYLVLKNPSGQSGVLGWECQAEIEGAGEFLTWTLEGEAINVQTPPEFQVGIGGDPLPFTPDGILLATFRVYIEEFSPVTLSLGPTHIPSLPGEMAFIPGDDSSALLSMTTLTGQPEVAWVNGVLPLAEITPPSLNFGIIPQGLTPAENIRIENGGGGILTIDAALDGECLAFSLLGNPGPHHLAHGESVVLTVEFHPPAIGNHDCLLQLGPGLAPYILSGTSREPVLTWNMPSSVNFGQVTIGETRNKGILIWNTGEIPILWNPQLPDGLLDFTITSVVNGDAIPPGQRGEVHLTFAPTTVGSNDFLLDLGDVLPDLPVTAAGREAVEAWVVTPLLLDFGDLGLGGALVRDFTVINTGETILNLDVALADPDLGFGLINPPPPFSLHPGHAFTQEVLFSSPVPGLFETRVTLGDPLPDVELRANVPLGTEPCLLTPPVLDFGTVTVGETYFLDFRVTNQQTQALVLDPSTGLDHLVVTGGPVTLAMGETAGFEVSLTPPGTGAFDLAIDLGDQACDPVLVTGVAEDPSCVTAEGPLDFGLVSVDVTHHQPLEVHNPFQTVITLDPTIDNPVFTVPAGPIVLQPGETHVLLVDFHPPVAGDHEGTLNLGHPDCPTLPILGNAHEGSCAVAPVLIDFGEVPLGAMLTRTVEVTNDGVAVLTVDPVLDGPHFQVLEGGASLAPGEVAAFTVAFQPTTFGQIQDQLVFGPDFCDPVTLVGVGGTSVGTDTDLIGIYFDNQYQLNEWTTTEGPGEIVPLFLVLGNLSNFSGTLAWECRVQLDGNGYLLDWVMQGQAINVGDESQGEFSVGLNEPLPWAPQVLLATGRVLSLIGSNEMILLTLGPVRNPSLPGSMAWIADDAPGDLIPLETVTGSPIVALISGSYPTPVQVPAPSAIQTGDAVRLRWSLPDGAGDGCHVYRRDPDGLRERLTAAPVVPEGREFRFEDRPFGYRDGSLVTYSYTVVTGGVEGAPSPETEVRLAAVPAHLTRLLPNVPNPFNPSTEVRFEVESAGRVHVSVYDVNGRLVRKLLDETLDAGRHHRTWDGRDGAGRQAPSGAYYVRLVTESRVDHRKVMLLK